VEFFLVQEVSVLKTVFCVFFGFFFTICPAFAQEIYVHGGLTNRTDSSDSSYAWGLTYLHGLGDYAAWSVSYMNEGHIPNHKRDGLSLQFWGRYPLFGRSVSLAAGIGPYMYFDTTRPSFDNSYSNTHGVGTVMSVSATLYTESRFLFQARSNWTWTSQNANTFATTIGIGYQLEGATKKDAHNESPHKTSPSGNNEVAILAGVSAINEWADHGTGWTGALEYRRNLFRYLEWSTGWLVEGGPVSRKGPMTQIWASRKFFDDRFSLGVGAGPYLGFEASRGGNVTKVDWLVSASASYQIHNNWAIRATWGRVTTDYDRDTDVVLSGIAYRF
jgi:hypothetical protein